MKHMRRTVLVPILGLVMLVPQTAALPGQGMLFTVGPGGTHSTIQAAVTAALASLASSPIEIRVAAGTYFENVYVAPAMNTGSVNMSGGWNASFTARDLEATPTTIDGGGLNSVLILRPSGGELTVDGFTIVNGGGTPSGTGLLVEPSGNAIVTIQYDTIRNNVAGPSGGGGGVLAFLPDATRLVMIDNVISDNRCEGGADGTAVGAGLWLGVDDHASFSVLHNRIDNNRASAPGNQNTGVGVYLIAYGAGSGEFSDNLVRFNAAGPGSTVGVAGAIWMSSNATGRINLRRNRWEDNLTEAVSEDLSLIAANTGTLLMTDSIVAGARSSGIVADARDNGAIYLTNLTVADNHDFGVFYRSGPGTKTLYNSIVFGNGTNVGLEDASTGNNLIDVDPRFVDSTDRNYRIRPTSPGIDAGDANPPGGLGPSDVNGFSRVEGGGVDIGAHEMRPPDFAVGAVPASVTLSRGAKTQLRIGIDRLEEHDERVTITPPSVAALGLKLKPKRAVSTMGTEVSFKLKVKASAVVGTHQLIFTARDESGRERTTTVTVTIQ